MVEMVFLSGAYSYDIEFSQVQNAFQGVDNEYKRDQKGETVLCETSDVFDQKA
jgi:hypothetical protein